MNSILYLAGRSPPGPKTKAMDMKFLRNEFMIMPTVYEDVKEALLRTLYSVAHINRSEGKDPIREDIQFTLLQSTRFFLDMPFMHSFESPPIKVYKEKGSDLQRTDEREEEMTALAMTIQVFVVIRRLHIKFWDL